MTHSKFSTIMRSILLLALLCIPTLRAEDAAPVSAKELAARLSANIQDGTSSVRIKMDIRTPADGPKTTLQLQIKARRTKAGTDVVYQVLYPKERKGESILLRRSGDRAASGSVFTLPDSLRPIAASQMKDAVFGSDLAYADLIENFFGWENQTIAGAETVDKVPCQILDSKPGNNDHSIYGRVRSWVDVKRLVTLRVEKYSESGQLLRRIDTTRVAEDDTDRKVAASLMVRRAGQESITEIEGSKSRHDVTLPDSDFTPEGLRALSAQGK
ncbi:MAG: outer membrane lipoprotein-sorting protein [Verrucomicrobia bacterium]|nr:outer membrane lipoprotein-sorting protein [Verrucomicrobiota bacterium]